MYINKEKLRNASHGLGGLNLLVFEYRLAQLCGFRCELLLRLALRLGERVGGLLAYMMTYDKRDVETTE